MNEPNSAADLASRFQACLDRPGQTSETLRLNREGRYCLWTGQTADGRKWNASAPQTRVIPWSGASDIKLPLVDVFCREDGAVLCTALTRAKLTVAGIESGDTAWAQRATNFLRWMWYNQMTERNQEMRLLSNFLLEDGRAVLGVFWDRQTRLAYDSIDLETITNLAAQSAQLLAKAELTLRTTGQEILEPAAREQMTEMIGLAEAVLDPSREDAAVQIIQQQATKLVETTFEKAFGPEAAEYLEDFSLTPAACRRIVRELREEGRAQIPLPTITRNRPTLVALKVDYDVFYENVAAELDGQTAVFRVEWLTADQLRARQKSHGWDGAWCSYVLEHGKGPGALLGLLAMNRLRMEAAGWTDQDLRELFPVVHAYQQVCNDDGIVELRCRVFATCATDPALSGVAEFAWDELLNYDHGQLPFTHFRTEYLSRRLDDTRGYGETAYTWQWAAKTEVDMQRDRSMLATNPPLHHPRGRPPSEWGPGARVPASPREYFYADLPEFDPGSNQVLGHVTYWANRWFGRPMKDQDPVLPAAMRQDLVDNWLEGWRMVLTQVFQLCQQFMPDEFYFRVVGSSKGKAMHASRDEIRGKFDLQITFSTADLDPQLVEKKLAAIQNIVSSLDINGIVDRDELLAVALEWVDPNLGERLLRPAESAAQAEIEDEQNVFARLWAGLEQNVKPGQAYQLRSKVLQDAIAGTDDKGQPKNPAAMKRYQQDESFKGIVDKRLQQLKFQVQQRQNAVIGRLGA